MDNVEGGPRFAAEVLDCRSNQNTKRRLQRLPPHCSLECFILAALPRLGVTQRLLGLLRSVMSIFDPSHAHNAAVLVVVAAPPGTEPSNLAGRKSDSEFQVERFVISDSGILLRFDCGEIVRMNPRTKGLVRSCMIQAIDTFEFPRPRNSPAV